MGERGAESVAPGKKSCMRFEAAMEIIKQR